MNHKTTGSLLMIWGFCLILAAAALLSFNLWDANRAEEAVDTAMQQVSIYIPEQVFSQAQLDPQSLAAIENTAPTIDIDVPYYLVNPEIEMPEQVIDGIGYIGVLEIPSLTLELPIISQWNAAHARISPCRYSGSAYLDNMVICAHNYSTHFGNLSSLSQGDLIQFTDMDGNLFTYEVIELEILGATQIEEMCTGDWDLTLFTCTIGGQSRVTVRCTKTQ